MLLVDDDEVNLLLTSVALRERGFQIVETTSGEQALRMLSEAAPDGVRVGLAGRSRARLEDVRTSLGERAADWPLLVADATDEQAVTDLATRISETDHQPRNQSR